VVSLAATLAAQLSLAQKQDLVAYLGQFATAERQAKIERTLAQRSRYLTVVLEDFHYSQNASAVLRTAEGLGLQDMYIVETINAFKLNPDVTRGCNKWLTLHHYNQPDTDNLTRCLSTLRQRGYTLVATCPHGPAVPPDQLPLDCKTALLLGSERWGLSERALAQVDAQVQIPMAGFLESYNVSVSAAICLYTLAQRLRQSAQPWQLSETEKIHLRLDWLLRSVRSQDALVKRFLGR